MTGTWQLLLLPLVVAEEVGELNRVAISRWIGPINMPGHKNCKVQQISKGHVLEKKMESGLFP